MSLRVGDPQHKGCGMLIARCRSSGDAPKCTAGGGDARPLRHWTHLFAALNNEGQVCSIVAKIVSDGVTCRYCAYSQAFRDCRLLVEAFHPQVGQRSGWQHGLLLTFIVSETLICEL